MGKIFILLVFFGFFCCGKIDENGSVNKDQQIMNWSKNFAKLPNIEGNSPYNTISVFFYKINPRLCFVVFQVGREIDVVRVNCEENKSLLEKEVSKIE